MHCIPAAAAGRVREVMYKHRETESVQAFLVKGQPDTDVIHGRWAWDNYTAPFHRGSFSI